MQTEQEAADQFARESWKGPDTSIDTRLAEAHRADIERNRTRQSGVVETAMIDHPIARETEALLIHKWAVHPELVRRIRQLETDLFLAKAELDSVNRRIEKLESRRK